MAHLKQLVSLTTACRSQGRLSNGGRLYRRRATIPRLLLAPLSTNLTQPMAHPSLSPLLAPRNLSLLQSHVRIQQTHAPHLCTRSRSPRRLLRYHNNASHDQRARCPLPTSRTAERRRHWRTYRLLLVHTRLSVQNCLPGPRSAERKWYLGPRTPTAQHICCQHCRFLEVSHGGLMAEYCA